MIVNLSILFLTYLMNVRPLNEFPKQLQFIVKQLDQVDVLVSNIIADGCRDEDTNSFSIPHNDIIVILELIQEKVDKSLETIGKYGK